MMTLKTISRSALLVTSLALMALSPAGAQPKPGMTKTVFENDKITVVDNVLKPGEESPSQDRAGLILYYISGGTVERTFADGKKEIVTRKTGQALMNPEKRPYAVTNTGSTTLRVITIKAVANFGLSGRQIRCQYEQRDKLNPAAFQRASC